MTPDHRRTILIVDDEPESLLYLRTVLGASGYDVVEASSLAEAKAEIASRRFCLILTDLRLAASSGLDVLEAAREADPVCVCIVLSGHGTVAAALEALREGAYDYLVKPCAPDILLAAVKRALEHYELRTTLIAKSAQLQRLEGQLDEKARLLQNVSHELKNPLSVVYGYAAFLLRQPIEDTKPEDMRRSLLSIHKNAERLNFLLEELLESSRLAGHKLELEREPVSAFKLLAEAVDNHRFDAVKHDVELSVLSHHGPDLILHADARRIHQILSNLIGNALKFTPAGGSITVSAEPSEGFARIRVTDTGVGISQDDMTRLFERFYQSEMTRQQHQGLGLGLDICKGLVELHGGHIWAESAPGSGSSFFFTVPLTVPHLHPPAPLDRRREKALE